MTESNVPRTEPHPITGEPEPVCVCGRRQSMHAPDGGCSGFTQDEAEWQRRMDAQNASAGAPAAEFLWGLHGAETFHTDPAACYERDLKQAAHPDDRHPREIEQWTSLSAGHFLPSPAEVAEYVAEWGADNMGTDGAAEAWDEARRDPEVVAAFAVASQLLASRVAYWMCGDLVATHTVTWTDDGSPLLDGEPPYPGTEEGAA